MSLIWVEWQRLLWLNDSIEEKSFGDHWIHTPRRTKPTTNWWWIMSCRVDVCINSLSPHHHPIHGLPRNGSILHFNTRRGQDPGGCGAGTATTTTTSEYLVEINISFQSVIVVLEDCSLRSASARLVSITEWQLWLYNISGTAMIIPRIRVWVWNLANCEYKLMPRLWWSDKVYQ